jgi:putative tryptophan/tyrosine transport system substrate-binding protein
MRRRDFLGTLLVTAAILRPLAGAAQQKAMPVVGFLRAGRPPTSWIKAFHEGLREQGYIDGQNARVEFRFTDGSDDQLPRLVQELVRANAAVIVASAAPAAGAAKNAMRSVPTIFVVANPVELGLVESLSRPGGYMTGLAETSADLAGKRLELLREIVPSLQKVAVLWDEGNPSNPGQLKFAEDAARTIGIQIVDVPVSGPNEFSSVFNRVVDGLLVLNSSLFTTNRSRLVQLAADNCIPAIYGYREVVEAGGLISYGPHFADLYRRAAVYAGKIINGAKPEDLPVEQPTKFELVINGKTSKALGLAVPPSLLARADELIE